ncbi:MAG: hypothetical protein IKS75_08450 [Clostridiales bacterium]|nr:hypothetical protein [Clostridiales bacterium]
MIKRLVKKKDSKQGAILVIVVLILALAMIFITAAMMLTQATRTRLYDNTMQSQARLTVTSASEVFLEALITQEITDDQIDKMLQDSPTRHDDDADKIMMIVDGVPGMSRDPDNCTYLDLYYPDTDDKNIVNADFSTIIGDERENVRIVLSVTHSDPHPSGRFKNQIDIAASVSTSQLRFNNGVGMVNPALGDVDDNTILLRGGSYEQTSDAIFFSDLVFAGGNCALGGGNMYKGNMVFLDGAYFSSTASVTGFSGDFYFIGNSSSDAGIKHNGNDNIWGSISSSSKFVFTGTRKAQDEPNYDQNGKVKDLLTASSRSVYFVDRNDSTVQCVSKKGTYNVTNKATSGVPSIIAHKVSVYKAYNYTSANPFPTDVVSQVFAELNVDGKTRTLSNGTKTIQDEYWAEETAPGSGKYIYHVIPEGTTVTKDYEVYASPITKTYPKSKMEKQADDTYKYKSGFELSMSGLVAKANSSGVIDLAPGYYHFTSGTTTNDNGIKPYVVAINGAKASEYRFYFASGTYNINNLVFALYNVQSNQTPIMFILEPGAKLEFSGANFRKTDRLCSSGFICINRGITNAADLGKYIRDKAAGYEDIVWSTQHTGKNGAQLTYSKYYDGIVKPSFYIFGTSGNDFKVGDSCIFEAYIGLYGGSYFKQRNDIASKIAIYGRIEADAFPNGDNPTGDFQMPYCPAPGEIDEEPDERAAKTKFEVAQIIYYY